MGAERKFYIDKPYLLEIEAVDRTTWSWEIYTAVSECSYKGMAIERQKNVIIPWTNLKEFLYEEEIENLCRKRMGNI